MIPVFDSAQMQLIKKKIAAADKIAIVTHPRPDGDAIGSSVALWQYLRSIDKKAKVIAPTDFPDFLRWMQGSELVINYHSHKELADKFLKEADVLFVLDFNDAARAEKMEQSLLDCKAFKIMIDHHTHPKDFCDVTFSFNDSAATAELIFHFIKKLDKNYKITKAFGECIYAGIMTDTGSFRFSSTTGDIHRIVAELLDAGVVPNRVQENIFDDYSERRMHLLGYCLKNKMKVIPELNTAYITLTNAELKRFNYKQGDTEGIVNYPLSIKGIKFSAFICQHEKLIKISFRSKGKFPVNEFSSQFFEGGGHVNAAGGKSSDSLKKTVERFLKATELYKKQLTK